jgi:hypothetical protein
MGRPPVFDAEPLDIGNEVTQPWRVLCDHCG